MFACLSVYPRMLLVGLALGLLAPGNAGAQSVLTFKYTPAPRAQVAIWIEDAQGTFLSTVALTDAVGYRGIGNRPGASDMNSGYRWPYGRREGVLPVWAHRRASAPGAKLFPRVIFQQRIEGLASRTTNDQSADSYYCLQFDIAKSSLDELDAVSCATPFTSDKGRYMTAEDVARGYGEPYEPQPGQGLRQPLPLQSHYPPRMDVTRCTAAGCFDHADVEHYAKDARAVMPDIDAVTIATPAGNSPQALLFSVPASWPAGEYHAYIEVNVEGDYNPTWSAQRFPTPKTPQGDWDSFATDYGYPYRGQPSLVWKVSFRLGAGADLDVGAATPAGRASWDYWSEAYGGIEPLSDADAITDAANSGVGRLNADAAGRRFIVQAGRFATGGATVPQRPSQTPPPAAGAAGAGPSDSRTEEPAAALDAGVRMPTGDASQSASPQRPAVAPEREENTLPAPPSAVAELRLAREEDPLRAYKWVRMRMRAADSSSPLHAYEVRVSSDAITDEQSFIRQGRQAKNASEDKEGATYLQLPTDVPAGDWIDATIGDLAAETHYFVGVRARDVNNRAGPLTIAEITTPKREFATVTPCFVATVAYGSPLAQEVGVLRRLRDRYLLPHAIGQRFVAGYYRVGAQLARAVEPYPQLRSALRTLLRPLVALAESLEH